MKTKIKRARLEFLFRSNDFFALEKELGREDVKFLESDFVGLVFDHKSLIWYSLICMLLIKKETAELHWIAAFVLSYPLCHLPGAYASALYHTRKAIQLDPNDIELKEFLLLFYEIPDQLVGKEEAIKIANEILEVKPSSSAAKGVLGRMK